MVSVRPRDRPYFVHIVRQYARHEFGSADPSFLELWFHVAFLIILLAVFIVVAIVCTYLLCLYGPAVYYRYPIVGNIALALLWLASVSYIYACEAAKELSTSRTFQFSSVRK